ncbi:MAG: hypothetical protein ACRD3J_30050 [Thermoanaerobaculia bacterium]
MPQSTATGWTAPFESPQLTTQPGCGGSPGYVRMWGNQTVGEAIQQTLSAPLVPGRTYRLSACVAHLANNPSLPQYVRFRVRLSNGPLASYTTPGTLMGILGGPPGITTTQWTTLALANFTVPNGPPLNTITINPENNNTANNGNTVSWGEIDNICLQDIRNPCPPLDVDFGLTATLTAGNSTTFKLTATTSALPAGAGFYWSVEEINLSNGTVIPGTTVSNPSQWWGNPLTNNFGGYVGTGTLVNSTNPGVFQQGHKYRITRGVWDPCRPWTQISHTVFMSTP